MTQIAARNWIFEIRTDTDPDVYVEIIGLTGFTLNRGENEEVADLTTFDEDGQYTEAKMQRGATLELSGRWKTDGAGARNAGQQAVDDLAGQMVYASQGRIRFRHVDDTDWTVWDATATPGEVGGENNDMTAWAVTLTRCGAATTASVA